jgi:hypothetical protein
MKERNDDFPGTGIVRISLKPGTSAIQLLAMAMEKSIRTGAGLISVKHFFWRDYLMLPALVHPSGKALAPARRRV